MRKKIKFFIIMSVLFFTMLPLIFAGSYGYTRFNNIQNEDGERTILIKSEDIKRDISINIDTIKKEVFDIANIYSLAPLEEDTKLKLISDPEVLDFIIYDQGEIISFKGKDYENDEILKNIQSQFYTSDAIVGLYEINGFNKVAIYSKNDNKDKSIYSILILEDDFFYRFIENQKPYKVYIMDGEYRVLTSNISEDIGSKLLDDLSKSMVDGEVNVQVIDSRRVSYDFIDFGEADIYLRVEEDIQGEFDRSRNYLIILAFISILVEAMAFLFAWKLIRIIDIEIVRSNLKASNRNVKDLLNKLDETVIWIDDVVNHYDELNLLKDDIIEIRNSLPKDSDKNDEEEKDKN